MMHHNFVEERKMRNACVGVAVGVAVGAVVGVVVDVGVAGNSLPTEPRRSCLDSYRFLLCSGGALIFS